MHSANDLENVARCSFPVGPIMPQHKFDVLHDPPLQGVIAVLVEVLLSLSIYNMMFLLWFVILLFI